MNGKENTFVLRTDFSCYDWHDMVENNHYLQEKEGTLCVENPQELIADDILSLFHDGSKVNREEVMHVVTSPEAAVCEITDVNPKGEPVTVGISRRVYEDGTPYINVDYDVFSQFECSMRYEIREIPADRTVYLVVEEFNPYIKGVSCVERFYHDFFTSYADAEKYRSEMKTHVDFAERYQHLSLPVAEIMVFDRDELSERAWYDNNRKAMTLMAEKGVDEYDDSFRMFCGSHIARLESCAGPENLQ